MVIFWLSVLATSSVVDAVGIFQAVCYAVDGWQNWGDIGNGGTVTDECGAIGWDTASIHTDTEFADAKQAIRDAAGGSLKMR